MKQEAVFPPEAASVTHARHFVTELLDGEQRDVVDAVALLVTELAANAVRHARSEFCVRVERRRAKIRIEVVDDVTTRRPEPRSIGPTSVSGRGLHIVDQFADDWGTSVGRHGKTVWFTVARARRADVDRRARTPGR